LLAQAVARARASEFYATHLAGCEVTGLEDLGRLPVTFKSHLRDASPYGMLVVPPSKAWHYHETSGTRGEPISTWCGLNELRLMGQIVKRMAPELEQDAILLNRFPLFAPVSFVFEEALRAAEACHIAAGNMTWDVPFTRVLDFIRRLHVTALSGLPLEPILLAELARMQGLDMRRDPGRIRVVFCGGAVLPPGMRRAIEQDWGARVIEIYGSNETMLMGVGCPHGRLHLCSDLIEFEVLDPTTYAPLPAGDRGLLTTTSLVHEAMPLVRYVTGDLARIVPEGCECGCPGPVAEVFGRFEEIVEIGEARATAYEILDAAYDFADSLGTRVFFILVRRRGLHVLVETDRPVPVPDREAEHRLARRIGLPVGVEYLRYNEVMDRTALFRGPKIYKPSQISDWRGEGRKTITLMEALLEWPRFDLKTLLHIAGRQVRNARRRRRLLREDRRA